MYIPVYASHTQEQSTPQTCALTHQIPSSQRKLDEKMLSTELS